MNTPLKNNYENNNTPTVAPYKESRLEPRDSCEQKPTLELKLSDLSHCVVNPLDKNYKTELVKHLDMTIKKLSNQDYYNSVKLPSCSHLAVYFITDELQMLEVFHELENMGYQFDMKTLYSPVILNCTVTDNHHSAINDKLHLYNTQLHHIINQYLY